MMLPMISEKEFCEHIEDDDFPIRYGNPVCIHTNDGHLLVCMTYKHCNLRFYVISRHRACPARSWSSFVCMTYKLYERLLERKEQVTGNEL